MVTAANTICGALKRIPCIGDGDTGGGNVANVKRTVRKYIQAGMSGIMIEDQGIVCYKSKLQTVPCWLPFAVC